MCCRQKIPIISGFVKKTDSATVTEICYSYWKNATVTEIEYKLLYWNTEIVIQIVILK